MLIAGVASASVSFLTYDNGEHSEIGDNSAINDGSISSNRSENGSTRSRGFEVIRAFSANEPGTLHRFANQVQPDVPLEHKYTRAVYNATSVSLRAAPYSFNIEPAQCFAAMKDTIYNSLVDSEHDHPIFRQRVSNCIKVLRYYRIFC